jgi:hypothetical protein
MPRTYRRRSLMPRPLDFCPMCYARFAVLVCNGQQANKDGPGSGVPVLVDRTERPNAATHLRAFLGLARAYRASPICHSFPVLPMVASSRFQSYAGSDAKRTCVITASRGQDRVWTIARPDDQECASTALADPAITSMELVGGQPLGQFQACISRLRAGGNVMTGVNFPRGASVHPALACGWELP